MESIVLLGLALCAAIALRTMHTKAAALRLFTNRVDDHCNEYERVRQDRNAEQHRLLEEFRSTLHTDSEDILRQASQVRTIHNLQAPRRDWERGTADPATQQLAEVETLCLAIQCQAPAIRKDTLDAYHQSLLQVSEGLGSSKVHLDNQYENKHGHLLRLREAELIAKIEDRYCKVLEADYKVFEDLLCFYEEAVVAQADYITAPLVQSLQALHQP